MVRLNRGVDGRSPTDRISAVGAGGRRAGRGVAPSLGWAAFLVIALAGSVAGAPVPAGEDTRGHVLWTGGCGGRYAVETPKGQSLLEWYGGIEPKKGDMLSGDLDTRGFKELRIGAGTAKTRAYIDLAMATNAGVAEKLRKACPYAP